ncbi:MAG: hypothetical protein KC476_00725 [Cyanobacteria bacterium HKST-UBA06]|nr:hypothetical protein [Cyanobacteria bacterium HKST-UBA05]MCA9806452.1 hypothetical protein [Cyanobacteria bacterium HKST-UBA06]
MTPNNWPMPEAFDNHDAYGVASHAETTAFDSRLAPAGDLTQDSALLGALHSLGGARNKFEAQVALNIIVVVVEHYFESRLKPVSGPPEIHTDALNPSVPMVGSPEQQGMQRQWYDIQQSLKSALQLVADAPDDTEGHVIPMIHQMVKSTLMAP